MHSSGDTDWLVLFQLVSCPGFDVHSSGDKTVACLVSESELAWLLMFTPLVTDFGWSCFSW